MGSEHWPNIKITCELLENTEAQGHNPTDLNLTDLGRR